MKRRKKNVPPTADAAKRPEATSSRSGVDDVVAILSEQEGRDRLKRKVAAAGERRRNGRMKSIQPPASEEMKTVTEIGSRRWKPGQTS